MSNNSKLLRINSRYRSQGSASNFVSCYNDSDVFSCTSFELVSFSMSRLYTNIHENNNMFRIGVFEGRVPPGQYDIYTLCAAMNALQGMLEFSVSGNYIAMKVKTSNPQYFFGEQSSIGRIIGQTTTIFLTGTRICSDGPYDLSGPQVFLQMPDMTRLCSESLANASTNFIPLLCHIPTDVEFRANIFYEPRQKISFAFGGGVLEQNSLNCIRIQLTDEFGNELNLPDTCYCNIVLKYYF